MKNADMPANPVPAALLYESRRDADGWERAARGLTKRELFAAMAMQGMLANTDKADQEMHAEGMFAMRLAENSVEFADALFAALEPKP